MAKRRKSKIEESQRTVVLEFFDERDGSDQFTMELSEEDFARYETIAASEGTPIEEFMAKVAEREIQERNTQWVIPTLDAFGRATLEGGTPLDLSNIAGTTAKGKVE
jgi:hypothetical protein